MKRNDGTGPAGHAGRRDTWPVKALLAARRRQGRPAPTTGDEDRRHVEADAERR